MSGKPTSQDLRTKLRLIWRWLLDVVDDKRIHGTLARFQFQSKLVFECSLKRWPRIVRGIWISLHRVGPCDDEGIVARDAGPVYDLLAKNSPKASRQIVHRGFFPYYVS